MVYLVDHKPLYASNIPLTNKTFQPFYIRITCGDTIRLLAAALETMKCNGTCSKHNKKKKQPNIRLQIVQQCATV